MKQHITVEQAKEIYDIMCEYLPRKGLAPKGYHDLAKWMTIGQMIEILQSKTRVFNMTRWKNEGEQDMWRIFLGGCPVKYENVELCDALFEAVKYVLGGGQDA